MTTLIQKMREELVRRAFAETTIRSYLFAVEDFRRYMDRRLDQLGPDDLRRYQVYLLEDKKLARGTVVGRIAALRFFYMKVLKRRDMKEDLPYPKRQEAASHYSQSRRNVAADRMRTEPIPSRHDPHDVRRWTETQRVVPPEGQQHRQSAHDAAH